MYFFIAMVPKTPRLLSVLLVSPEGNGTEEYRSSRINAANAKGRHALSVQQMYGVPKKRPGTTPRK